VAEVVRLPGRGSPAAGLPLPGVCMPPSVGGWLLAFPPGAGAARASLQRGAARVWRGNAARVVGAFR
jgi:hypothetical protein